MVKDEKDRDLVEKLLLVGRDVFIGLNRAQNYQMSHTQEIDSKKLGERVVEDKNEHVSKNEPLDIKV